MNGIFEILCIALLTAINNAVLFFLKIKGSLKNVCYPWKRFITVEQFLRYYFIYFLKQPKGKQDYIYSNNISETKCITEIQKIIIA